MRKQLVLIGGGHAHMVTLARLEMFVDKGFGVTVVQPSRYHYYSGMGPGMLGGTYVPDDIRFDTETLVTRKGGKFVLAKAYRIDPVKQEVWLEDTDHPLKYDVLSCNAGSYVPIDMIEGRRDYVFPPKPIEELFKARELLIEQSDRKKITVAVLGSGPSAVEIAGNIAQLGGEMMNRPLIQLFGGENFMGGRPGRVRKLCRDLLIQKGVEIIEKSRVERVLDGQILLNDGSNYTADIVFPAIGVRPSAIFARSGLSVGPDGGLLVNGNLQSVDFPNIFGGGDCICFQNKPLDKVGVFAVRQNPVLFENLMASLGGNSLQQFSPGGSYLLIYNLGDGIGVLSKWSITFAGKLAFKIKDYIDRKFIASFKLS